MDVLLVNFTSKATSINLLGETSNSSVGFPILAAEMSMLSLAALFLELKPSSKVESLLTDSSLVRPGSFEVEGRPRPWKKDFG
jgi:hypothetical protein